MVLHLKSKVFSFVIVMDNWIVETFLKIWVQTQNISESQFFPWTFCLAINHGTQLADAILVTTTKSKIWTVMPHLQWHHCVIISKIKTVDNIKRKLPENPDKQNSVTKVEMKAESVTNVTWNMIACMSCVMEDQGRKFWCFQNPQMKDKSKSGDFMLRRTE